MEKLRGKDIALNIDVLRNDRHRFFGVSVEATTDCYITRTRGDFPEFDTSHNSDDGPVALQRHPLVRK